MSKTVKIAISLPEDLLQAAERECQLRGQSRSEFFRVAAEALLSREAERKTIEAYVRGYQEQPESEEEVRLAEQSAAVLALEPWE